MNIAVRILALAEARSIEATGRRDAEWMNAYLTDLAAAMMGGVSAGFLRLGARLPNGAGDRGKNGPGDDRPAPWPPGPPRRPRQHTVGAAKPASWPTGRRRHGH